MCNWQKFVAVVTMVVASLAAHAQTSDWRVVEQISPGSRLAVAAFPQFVSDCIFQSASAETLFCRGADGLGMRPLLSFDRRRVWQISLHERQRPRHLGKMIGASLGAVVGVIGPTNATARDRVVTGIVFGSLGVLAGAWADDLPRAARGAVIYEKRAEGSWSPAPGPLSSQPVR